MTVFVPLRINAIELAHTRAQVAIDRLHNDMKMVVHQAVGMANPVKPATHLAEQIDPALPVRIAKVDVLAAVTPRCDVV